MDMIGGIASFRLNMHSISGLGDPAAYWEGQVALESDVAQLRGGDLDALSALLTRYQNRLYRYLLRLVREPAEAEELVPLEEADAEENTGKVKAVVPESEDDIEIDETIEDDDDDDSTFIADEEEGDEDVTDIIGDVGGDEET